MSTLPTNLLVPGQPSDAAVPTFKSTSLPAAVSFAFEKISPPAGVYIQRDDQLLLEFLTQVAPETVTVQVRILQPFAILPGQPDSTPAVKQAQGTATVGPGYIQTISFPLRQTVNLNLAAQLIQLQEGYVLSVTAFASTAARVGDTFVRVSLNRGQSLGNVGSPAALLAAGYVTTVRPIGWPIGPYGDTSTGPGKIQGYNPANPAAGVDFSATSNIPGRVRPVFLSAKLVTSAVAGNRVVSFALQGAGSGNGYIVQDTAAILASTTARYSIAQGATNVRGAGAIATEQDITLPLPASYFSTGAVFITSITQGLLAGDQWSQIQLVTEEWLENL